MGESLPCLFQYVDVAEGWLGYLSSSLPQFLFATRGLPLTETMADKTLLCWQNTCRFCRYCQTSQHGWFVAVALKGEALKPHPSFLMFNSWDTECSVIHLRIF